MKKRQKLITGTMLILLAIVTAVILYVNNRPEQQNDTPTVRYAAPLTIAAAPTYVAEAKGFWKEEGVNVEMTYFDSGRKALDALLSNNAEVMSVSETPPLRSYIAGSKINIVATVTEHKEAKMTVRTDKITAPGDVKGKKLGTIAGTNSDYYMYRWIEAHNLKPSDVEIVQLDAAALSQAFVQGNVDVMFAWEPYNYNASSKIPTLAESWPTEEYSGRHSIVMNSDYLKDNSALAQRIIKGFIKAEEYIKNNPEDAKKIVMKKTGMSEDALNKLWSEYTYKVQLDDGLSDIITSEASWITSSGGSNSSVDAMNIVSPAQLMSVDQNRIGEKFKR